MPTITNSRTWFLDSAKRATRLNLSFTVTFKMTFRMTDEQIRYLFSRMSMILSQRLKFEPLLTRKTDKRPEESFSTIHEPQNGTDFQLIFKVLESKNMQRIWKRN